MAKHPETVHIFHLYRSDESAVFLHPFRKTDKLFSMFEKSDLVGHYGREPRVESLTLFRNELYRLVEQQVRSWISDARFIPRFLLSAAAFLLTYLFLAFVVRDPLPFVDELAVGLGVSILAYILLGRKDLKSETALKKRISLRSKVDGIVFSESAFVKRVEQALSEKDNQSVEALIEQVTTGESSALAAGADEEAQQLVGYLERQFKDSDFKKTQKRLKRLSGSGDSGKESIRRWLETRKIDVPLLSLYLQLRKEVKTPTS